MTTTLAQLKSKVTHKLGETDDDGMLDNLTESINAGLQQMASEYDWPWLLSSDTFNTVAGQTDYSMPTNATRIRKLVYRNSALTRVQFEELVFYTDAGSNSDPALYYIQNSTIKLAPIPSGIFAITREFVRPESVLSSDSDTILCPDWYSDLAAVYATIEEAKRRGDQIAVNLWEASKDRWVQRLHDNITRGQDLPDILTRVDW